jgi:ATP-dependent RNA helicase HelY
LADRPAEARRRDEPAPASVEVAALRDRLRAHACHRCPDRDEHLRWADRASALASESAGLERAAERRTGGVANAFDRICELLVEQRFLSTGAAGLAVTARGERLGRLYTELDLVAAECLETGVWTGLDAAALAACVSALVYEGRRPDDATPPRMPPGAAAVAVRETVRVWSGLHALELRHRVDPMREPDLGIAWAAHTWASGASLETVLLGTDLAPGDFVRWMRQLVDLLGQVADAAGGHEPTADVRAAARGAARAIHRGVVAYSSVG